MRHKRSGFRHSQGFKPLRIRTVVRTEVLTVVLTLTVTFAMA